MRVMVAPDAGRFGDDLIIETGHSWHPHHAYALPMGLFDVGGEV